MGRLALAGSHGFAALEPWAQGERRDSGGDGSTALLDAGSHLMLPRHGIDRYTPAQRVDHAANMAALREAGCDRVLAVCSVGSLHAELAIGEFLCPSDFIAPGQVVAVFGDERDHVVPAFDATWRRLVLESWRAALPEPIRDTGVYWQSPGPRFETPAEVRLIARHADVVGMTMASECVAACQLGLAYAAVCVVDNLANGVAESPLTPEQYEAGHAANRERVVAALTAIIPPLAAGDS
jgi:5'-methylthioadenosine phosphorylase